MPSVRKAASTAVTAAASEHIAQNIEAVSAVYEQAERGLTRHQRGAERITAHLARPRFLYLIVLFVVAWMGLNLLAGKAGWPCFDPAPFFWLQGVVGLSALLMATIILITQQGQGKMAGMRAHLDLQVNLLAEKKIAKLIELVEELRRDMPSVKDRYDPEAAAMEQPANPNQVVKALERSMESAEAQNTGSKSSPR